MSVHNSWLERHDLYVTRLRIEGRYRVHHNRPRRVAVYVGFPLPFNRLAGAVIILRSVLLMNAAARVGTGKPRRSMDASMSALPDLVAPKCESAAFDSNGATVVAN